MNDETKLNYPEDYELDPDGFTVPNAAGRRKLKEASSHMNESRLTEVESIAAEHQSQVCKEKLIP